MPLLLAAPDLDMSDNIKNTRQLALGFESQSDPKAKDQFGPPAARAAEPSPAVPQKAVTASAKSAAELDRSAGALRAFPVLITVLDLAQLSGFSPHTIRDWTQQGLLPAIKIGNRLRFERDGAILALRNLNKKRRRRKRYGEGQSKT